VREDVQFYSKDFDEKQRIMTEYAKGVQEGNSVSQQVRKGLDEPDDPNNNPNGKPPVNGE
jgi:hypothetical protein